MRDWPGSAVRLELESLLMLFLPFGPANVLYSLACLPGLFVQISASRQAWKRAHGGPFLIGTAFAAIITRFIAVERFVRDI